MNPTRAGKVAYLCLFISKNEIQKEITFLDNKYQSMTGASIIRWIPYRLKKL